MVSVYIYLNGQSKAEELMHSLLSQQLAAHASVDYDNTISFLEAGVIKTKKQCLVTLQTKAMLFNSVVKLVQSEFGFDTRIYSLPITQANENFSDFIRDNTLKI